MTYSLKTEQLTSMVTINPHFSHFITYTKITYIQHNSNNTTLLTTFEVSDNTNVLSKTIRTKTFYPWSLVLLTSIKTKSKNNYIFLAEQTDKKYGSLTK